MGRRRRRYPRQTGGLKVLKDIEKGFNQVKGALSGEVNKVKGKAAGYVIDSVSRKAKRKLNSLIRSKVKNKKVQGLLENQLNAAIPYLKLQAVKAIQGGAGQKRRRRHKRIF